MWHEIWVFLREHYIFDTMIVALIITLIAFIWYNFRRIKSIGKNGIELRDENDQKIDPYTSCPYTESKKRSMEAIEKNAKQIAENTKSIDALAESLKIIMAKIDEFRMDQLKDMFVNKDQHLVDRMYSGLKYVAKGGNGKVKESLIVMIKENPDVYEMAIKPRPDLRLKEAEKSIRG